MSGRLALSPVQRGIPPTTGAARLDPRLVQVFSIAGSTMALPVPAAGSGWTDRHTGDVFLSYRTRNGASEPFLTEGIRLAGFSAGAGLAGALWSFGDGVDAPGWGTDGHGGTMLWHLRDVGDVRAAVSDSDAATAAVTYPEIVGIASPAIVGGAFIASVQQTSLDGIDLGASFTNRYQNIATARSRSTFDSGAETLPSAEGGPAAETLFAAFGPIAGTLDTEAQYGTILWAAEGRMA